MHRCRLHLARALTQHSRSEMDARPASSGKRRMPDTPDREASTAKRRRLIPMSHGTGGVPPEMAAQVANFRLMGNPKQNAYKPRKRTPVGESKY